MLWPLVACFRGELPDFTPGRESAKAPRPSTPKGRKGKLVRPSPAPTPDEDTYLPSADCFVDV